MGAARRGIYLTLALLVVAMGLFGDLRPTAAAQFDTEGLVDIGNGAWHLRNSQGQVTTFTYGNPGDLPIAGDWDGDGVATPALYRQSDGFFYARNSNSTGIAHAECFAGDAADVPVVGDWDGDGDDNLGLYRPSVQRFFLFTTTCADAPMGAAQIDMGFGNPGDKPVAGDWDGDGIDEVGLHRESTGFFYWRNTLDTGIADGQIFFGDPGDRFASGDWGTIDGIDTPGIYRPTDQTFYRRHTLTQGVADSQLPWPGAAPGWLPVSGYFGLDPLASGVGFDEATGTITLGVLASTSGVMVEEGQAALQGHQDFWARINAGGGVAGQYPVELEIRNNASDVNLNLLGYNQIRAEVLAISSILGDDFTSSIVADAATRDILLAAGSKSSRWALEDNVVLNLATGTYFTELANGVHWATNIASPAVITGGSVVGIVFEASDYGQECKDGYDIATAQIGITSAFEDTYAVGDSDFSSQIGGAQAAGVDVLFVCATPSKLAPIIGTMAALTYFPTVLGSSPSYRPTLNAPLGGGNAAAGAALFNQFPYHALGTTTAWEEGEPGMVQMRADFMAGGSPLSTVTAEYFFGYTQGMTMHAILERAVEERDITRAGVLAAVPLVTDVDLGLGGGPAGYGTTPADRIPTREDAVGLVTTTNLAQFGLIRVGGFFTAPFLANWAPS